jgi:hypothetical protein
MISTNANAEWTPVQEYSGASAGWQLETVDLTAYLGKVVQLGWSYGLLSWEGGPRPGWLIDDVSIAVSQQQLGTLTISNNLAQASFSLDGPVARVGQGMLTTYTNLPTGEYLLRFRDVPYYQTPPPQTNLLGTDPLVFEGVYTFPDLNQNGISDLWETEHFGEVAMSQPPRLDRDGDGFHDLAEFLAGTNPTDPKSNLQLFPPVRLGNGICRLTWPSVPGHIYRLRMSTDALRWNPISPWLRARGNQLSYTVPVQDKPSPLFFQLETIP